MPPRASHPSKPATAEVLLAEPVEAAKAASLRYVHDRNPGISRRRAGKGFRYFGPEGRLISDVATLQRIHELVIPPAWTDVWICPNPLGHIQATGRDARGRKQYLYHPRWRAIRDVAKFAHMARFGAALPKIRRRVRRDLALPGVPREKVLATLVRLLETTLIRVGNDEYARANGSFGLTTLKNRHAEVHGDTIRFHFHGKSGKEHDVDVTNPRLARLVRRCQELPGQDLFQYVDEEGKLHPIGSADVNDYLREITGEDFTAKDFRTWAATLLASQALAAEEAVASPSKAQRIVARVVQSVAARLGNTASVCRKSYIHPGIIEDYFGKLGSAARNGEATVDRAKLPPVVNGKPVQIVNGAHRAAEAALLRFLRRSTRGVRAGGL